MLQVNVHDAKTHLSSLLNKVAKGESFIVAKSGKPVAKVVPYVPVAKRSRVGFLSDINVPDNFNDMGADEIAEMFEGVLL
ncbi:MAG: type II toxin-antitoxin system prevent-host-death family antitoxin [Defluviitaleaceae bacterium]|nr:type II toxin-antitoxin system prevent-host-death family antitoxin [Defluviitaleaceae bacterium]